MSETSPPDNGSGSDARVGLRLRTARNRAGLSQRKLALASGVSNATVSLIEKDKLNPSLGMLLKIIGAMALSLPEFWEIEGAGTKVFHRFSALHPIKNNRVTYRQVGDAGRTSAMIFQHESYEPGMDGRTIHTAGNCEMVGIVIEGRLEVFVGDQRAILTPGDCYRFDGKTPHRFRVIGNTRAVAVSCTVPPSF